MSFHDEHPDHAFERRQEIEDERLVAERHAETRERHTPAYRPTSAMSVLAYSVLHSEERDARGAARALAQLVLDAGEST